MKKKHLLRRIQRLEAEMARLRGPEVLSPDEIKLDRAQTETLGRTFDAAVLWGEPALPTESATHQFLTNITSNLLTLRQAASDG